MNYYNKSIEEIFDELKTSKDGLSNDEIDNRINKYGLNILVEKKKKSKFKKFLNQFNDMMIIILIIVMFLTFTYAYFYSNDYVDGIIIFIVIIINAIMGFIQEEKAEVTLDGLKKYSTSTCNVERNNEIKNIDTSYLVPGDIIILNSGDKVPCDARIIECNNLRVDESSLTGESISVLKNNKVLKGKLLLQEQSNMVFAGTSITLGTCKCVVCKTGMNTEIGSVALSLNTPYEMETPLQIKIKELSKKITFIVFIIIIIVFIYSMFKQYSIYETISLCIALSVSAIPEGLPAVITVTLSIGVKSLAKKKTIVKQMSSIETLGSLDVICSDKTGTITQNKMTIKKEYIYNFDKFKYIASLNNEGLIENNKYIGDPTETCLYEYLKNKNIDVLELRKEYKRIDSIPFDSERKLSSSINIINDKKYILTKGSIENLIDICNYYDDGNVHKLDNNKKEEILKLNEELSNNALRVLGFAYKEVNDDYSEDELIFVGLVGIIDPPREDIKDAIKKCNSAGIRPIMITGDSLETACSIAYEVGIIKDEEKGILGSDLDDYDDKELISIVKKYSVYARVNPMHKSRIIKALQKDGKVVAMTGDGVNDAPAIKDAQVGVGMGITGTDVTKSVSDIILLDDSFSTIVVAIEEGRKIFSNIRNNIVYALSSNFAEIFCVFVGIFTDNTILLPIQILFIDLITDSIPNISLSFERGENDIMNNPPRGINKPLFTPFVNSFILTSSFITASFVLFTYFLIASSLTLEGKITLALLSMVIQEIVYSFSTRNLKEFIYKQGLFSNRAMNIGIIIVIIIELIVFLTPVGKYIGIVRLDNILLLKTVLFNLLSFVIYELIKPLLKRLFKD